MLEVKGLTKSYGGVNALKGISFDVSEGEILGFLGPNGAGKSTTMRIITGYLPATSGRVTVDGFDGLNDSLEVRKRVGYLPEHTPLYTDMRVGEYLRYRAHIKGVRWRDRSRRVAEAMNKTLIADRAHQMIHTLSKGYRQRVGIADALIAEPRLLILDEPTIGLDPNQVRQVRELIKTLAEQQTVIISTHILAEVEMICDRVVMLHHGQKVADDKIETLIQRHDKHEVILEFATQNCSKALIDDICKDINALSSVSGVSHQVIADRHSLTIQPTENIDIREQLSRYLVEKKRIFSELRKRRVSLEDVFSQLTLRGQSLKQEEEAA